MTAPHPTREGNPAVDGYSIPPELDENHLLTLEEFCTLTAVAESTVVDWQRRGVGPRWWRFGGTGRLYTTAGEAKRHLPQVAHSGPHVNRDVQ